MMIWMGLLLALLGLVTTGAWEPWSGELRTKGEELLVNAGFERGLDSWRGLNPSGSCTFEQDKKERKAGKYSLRIARGAAARRADRFAGLAPSAAVTWPVLPQLDNFLNLATFALHGSEDPACPVQQARDACSLLARFGATVEYAEFEGGVHGTPFPHLNEAYAWLSKHPRKTTPTRVSKSLSTLRSPWAYWVEITGLEKKEATERQHFATGGLDGEIQGQRIRLFSEGIESVRLYLSPAMLDLDSEVIVEWNGKVLFEGVPERSLRVLLETAIRKVDWTAGFEVALDLKRGR